MTGKAIIGTGTELINGLLGSQVRVVGTVEPTTSPRGKEYIRKLAASLLRVGDAIRVLEDAADAATIALEEMAAHGVACDRCHDQARDVTFIPNGDTVRIVCSGCVSASVRR